jgi:hypothetical protein
MPYWKRDFGFFDHPLSFQVMEVTWEHASTLASFVFVYKGVVYFLALSLLHLLLVFYAACGIFS